MGNTARKEAGNFHWNLLEIQGQMQKGYGFMEQKKSIDACKQWLKVWFGLQEHISSNINSIEDVDSSIIGLGGVYNWCQDFESELWNAGLDDKKYHYERIQYCEDFCTSFPRSSEDIIVNMQRAIADSNYEIGDIEKGEETYRTIRNQFPNNVWGYIGWGDIYAFGTNNNIIKENQEKAKKIYELALNQCLDDEKLLYERLKELECCDSG